MAKPLAYRSFLLTAWEERRQAVDSAPVWRFGLEDVRSTNRRRVFATLEEVVRYVKEELTGSTVESTLPGEDEAISLNDESGEIMTTITSPRNDILVRRYILEPGEALPWHTDLCQRVVITIRGDQLRTEYRDSAESETLAVQSGTAHWRPPQPRLHRAVNIGNVSYERVVIFFLNAPEMEPQPEVK